MNLTRPLPWLALLFPLSALAAGDPPGTAKLISNATFLNEQATGDSFAQISTQDPVIFTLTGPGKFQVDFRVNVKKKGGALKPVNLEIFAGDSILTQLRINARAGRGGAWRNEKDIKPSEPASFILQLAAGTQNVMFRIDESAVNGAAVNVVEAGQARKQLPADTPVLEVPVIAAAETPPNTATATPTTTTPAIPQHNDTSTKTATNTPANPPRKDTTTPVKPDKPAEHVETKPEVPPDSGEAPKPRVLTFMLGGGVGVQNEVNAFGSSGLGAGLIALGINLPAHLFIAAEYQFRYGSISVPVTGSANTETPELRHEIDIAFGWAPALVEHGDFSLTLPLGLSYQALVFSNAIAPSLAGLIGLDVGLRLNKGWFTGGASIGYGQRIHDSTPLAALSGPINGRLRWQGDLVVHASPVVGAFVSYQGESIARGQTSRIANAMLAGITLSPL